ncbi:sodium:solute symporter [Micrococcus yunnanensis]|uniref:sodium:solute symporter n=1 Tax=Micrococcus yunnanensis TaxID=566027 RepID=UPI0017892F52|nr:sodium:solute symporter [Micrococcus yunnanensis]MBE1538172.1 SSS family solute:Na+ symporter [Micrococcus yunnanensis]
MTLNLTIVAVYLVGMLAFGWWGKARAASSEDYLVAGRRLGPVLFTGTMAAVVLGGAATVGGVGLGYEFGLSGAWLVAAIGVGVLILSVAFAPILARLKIYTVSQMLRLRYGRGGASHASSFVMLAYTLMLAATSTGAYASIFVVLFGWDRWLSVLVGGGIVLAYSVLGGMWSITLADMAQFLIMTIGLFALMLPLSLAKAGGWSAMQERLGAEFFSWDGIGVQSIVTYFVIYTLGLLIGQDVWQRVFTARSPRVAQIGGATAGLYCIVYGVAGAVIGMAARTVTADIATQDDVFAWVAQNLLPVGVGGVALAAAVAAMMSTASGAIIAASTVMRTDILPILRGEDGAVAEDAATETAAELASNRGWVLLLGAVVLGLAIVVPDVVAALTIAYDILVGGLFVAIVGGLVWKRGTGTAALWSMVVGTVGTLGTMGCLELNAAEPFEGVFANEPIYVGLAASAVVYVLLSLMTRPTDPAVLEAWRVRSRHGVDPAVRAQV